ncbi:hypothetical protein C8Q80DRAFT_482020 [Daedaleopsis nitida]|nr:hypothetical protein C8Q80DRAFT_482020 [Daedaleopsis nitida]
MTLGKRSRQRSEDRECRRADFKLSQHAVGERCMIVALMVLCLRNRSDQVLNGSLAPKMDPTTGTPQVADPSLAGPPITLPSKAATFGALYIGLSVSILLYGFSLHQTLRYYRSYPQDRIVIKIWVLLVMIVETLTTAFMFHTTYLYLVVGGASLIQLGEAIPW